MIITKEILEEIKKEIIMDININDLIKRIEVLEKYIKVQGCKHKTTKIETEIQGERLTFRKVCNDCDLVIHIVSEWIEIPEEFKEDKPC